MPDGLVNQVILTCKAVIGTHSSLLWGLFVVGLVGGATHCAVQCGVFVSAVGSAPRGQSFGGILTRLRGVAVLPYHLGRTLTYMILAAFGAMTGQVIATITGMTFVTVVLLVLAALFFLLSALGGAVRLPVVGGWRAPLTQVWGKVTRPFSRLGQFPLGLVMGLMPCAMSSGAIFAAAATGEPLTALFGLGAFGLGTSLALIPTSAAIRTVFNARTLNGRGFTTLQFFNAFVLFALAARVFIQGV